MFHVTCEVVALILACVSRHGWVGGPYTDDNLSSAKMYPGFQHKATNSKQWPARIRVTGESMSLMIDRISNKWATAPTHYRKKPDKAEMEVLAERAAAVWHCGQELMKEVPIPEALITERYYKRYAEGDTSIETDIIAGLIEKTDQFDIRDIAVLHALIGEHQTHKPVQMSVTSLAEIDNDRFHLELKQAQYDMEVYRVRGNFYVIYL